MMTQIKAYQYRVSAWIEKCFGREMLYDRQERAQRLLEEAVEAAQAAGVGKCRALRIVDVVYDRPVGEISQELAGVAVTLFAMAESTNTKLGIAIDTELRRLEAKDPEVFRARNREKAAQGIGNYPNGK